MAAWSTERPASGVLRRAAWLGSLTLLVLAGRLAVGAPAAAPPEAGPPPHTPLFHSQPAPPCDRPMCYWASSLQAEKNHIVLTHVDIVDTTRGPAHITADRADATGAQLGDSRWVLTGKVQMDMPEGQLRADTATVQMMNNRISSIVAQGQPAEFQRLAQPAAAATVPRQPPGGSQPKGPAAGLNLTNVAVYGHADTITYEVKQGLVQLTGNSWLTDGCNEFTSPLITYEVSTQKVQAGPEPGTHGRVHGTIRSTHPGQGSCAGGLGAS